MPAVPPPPIDRRSAAMLAALALLWGGSFFFAQVALTELAPLTIVLHRLCWAVPVLAYMVWRRGLSMPRSARAWGCYAVMGALNNAIPFSLIVWGQATVGSALAAILNSTTAFFGALVAGLMLADERLTPAKLSGAALGLAGVAAIMGWQALAALRLDHLAQLAVLGAAVSYAVAGVWGKRYLSAYQPLTNALGMVSCSALMMAVVVLLVDGLPRLDLSAPVWAALIALASLSTALAYLLYFAILARAGSANLMLVTLLIPPVAAALGVAVLGESLGRGALFGYALIALGLVVSDGRALAWLRGRGR